MSIDFDTLGWLLGLSVLIIVLASLWQRGRSVPYLFCFSMFWVYLLLILKETIFPITFDAERVQIMRAAGMLLTAHMNFIPFYFGPYTRLEHVFPGLVLNILLTAPFGFGVSFIVPCRRKDFIWCVVIGGFGIEILQFIISLMTGYSDRVIDINDVLMNTLGVLLGYGLFKLFAWSFVKMVPQLAIKPTGFLAFIHEVVRRA